MRDWRDRNPFEERGEVYETGTKPGAATLTQHLPVQRKAAPRTAGTKVPSLEGDYAFVQAYSGGVAQMKEGGGGAAFPDEQPTAWMSSSGAPMETGVRTHMEQAFNADFSAVRIHQGDHATNMGAHAFAHGADIHFGPGQYAPDSESGRSLLGHELAHVVQQSQGRVSATTQAKGISLNDDDSLEREADDLGARAARGEQVGAGRATVTAGAVGSMQRYAFVKGKQVTNTAGVTGAKQSMISDKTVRDYTDDAEFTSHAAKKTDYLGNLKDGTWLRFNPTGTNLLGENHTLVRAEESVPAVGSTSFIYEPFSFDDMSTSPEMKAAYEKENAERFKTFGVDGVPDKQQFGEESLYPKIGYNMNLALPYFKKTQPLDDLKPAGYVGQPIQRYLKISWGMTKDAVADVTAKRAAKDKIEPKYEKMADAHTAVSAQLDAFITGLPLEGFLGDELTKAGNDTLLAPLAKYAKAVEDAMLEKALGDPSAPMDPKDRAKFKKSGANESQRETIFSDWRNAKFEESVAAATAKGVRYAGMGQAHLEHLIAKGLTADQHPYKMADVDLTKFQNDTKALEAAAVAVAFDPTKVSTAELLNSWKNTADAAEKTKYEAELKTRTLHVTVTVKKAQENPDEVYVKAECGGKVYKSNELKMKSGASNVFGVPVSVIWPISGPININVFDADQLSKDDLISTMVFKDPWTPVADTTPRDGAQYESIAEFKK